MRVLEITIAAFKIQQEITLPMKSFRESTEAAEQNLQPCLGIAGQSLSGCVLQRCISIQPESEIWLASDEFKRSVAVKIMRQAINIEIMRKLSELKSEYLVPVWTYGVYKEYSYEIMPYYKNGSIYNCRIDEETIREKIAPGLIAALRVLHKNELIHNDVKPENIFWDDEKKHILLGDYGCVSMKGEKVKGYSLAYAAPEILLGNKAQFASDWVSVGLTLGSLLQKEKIVPGITKSSVLKWWEGSFVYDRGSQSFNQLINGMIQKDMEYRLGSQAIEAWVSNNLNGTESRSRYKRASEIKRKELIFENPRFIVKDIGGVLLAMEHYWEHFIFLQKQGRIEDFLKSISEDCYMYCCSLRKKYDTEQSVFLLSCYLSDYQYFIWRGRKYECLYEMEQTWDYDPDSVKTFLLNGSVKAILEMQKASEKELAYVQELMDVGRMDAEKACSLLFTALRGDESFIWDGKIYRSIEELLEYICYDSCQVDEIVEKLLDSERFRGWMSFLGYGEFVESIKKMQVGIDNE